MRVPGCDLLICADHSIKRFWQPLHHAFTAKANLPLPDTGVMVWSQLCTFCAGQAAGSPCVPEGCKGTAQVDALVEGVATQLPGTHRALCTRRALRHVLLALQEELDALMVDGDDVYFTC